jgi:hypothetical protein
VSLFFFFALPFSIKIYFLILKNKNVLSRSLSVESIKGAIKQVTIEREGERRLENPIRV